MPRLVIWCGLYFFKLLPLYNIAPLVAVYTPVIKLNVDVFPAPFGP